MSDQSDIEWTDATWNPTVGCSPVSPGCAHCYAEVMSKRQQAMARANIEAGRDPGKKRFYLNVIDNGRWNGRVNTIEDALTIPLRWKKPKTIFVNSMSDLFWGTERDLEFARRAVKDPKPVPFDFIDRVFAVMALCPQHTFQILTKRPERMAEYLNTYRRQCAISKAVDALEVQQAISCMRESWRPVSGHVGYEVSNLGNVRGPRGLLTGEMGEQGHVRVTMHGGERSRELVHRLVLTAFDREPMEDEQVRHRNGDATCNALPNLCWGSQSENWDDRKRHGDYRSYSKLTPNHVEQIKHLFACGHPATRLARKYGISDTQVRNIGRGNQWAVENALGWPLKNCWLGTSTENQKTADERIPHLLRCPAAVRFLSCEPLLGDIDLAKSYDYRGDDPGSYEFKWPLLGKLVTESPSCGRHIYDAPAINWVIVGGESGPGARPCDITWIRSIVQQCRAAGVACFVKQCGAHPIITKVPDSKSGSSAILAQGAIDAEWPLGTRFGNRTGKLEFQGREAILKDSKGGNMTEWPEDLRVRQTPATAEVGHGI